MVCHIFDVFWVSYDRLTVYFFVSLFWIFYNCSNQIKKTEAVKKKIWYAPEKPFPKKKGKKNEKKMNKKIKKGL